jgi:hypothetical protein
MATFLLGVDWAKKVMDISEVFYGDYSIGAAVSTFDALVLLDVSPANPSGNMNIFGYPALSVANVIKSCPALSVPTPASTVTAWPFKEIPKSFAFNSALDVTSSASADIRYLQELLAYLGPDVYAEARVTGNFGPLTEQAVRNFQTLSGITANGVVGSGTQAALNARLDAIRSGSAS